MTETGALLRRLRVERGYSLVRFAREANYSKGYISKLENGDKPVSPEMARRFDRILETQGVLTRAVAGPVPAPPVLPDGPDPWALVLGGTDPLAPNSTHVDEQTVEVYAAAFETWRMMGHRMSPAFVLPNLVGHCRALRELIAVNPLPDLIRQASRYAEYAGWMYQEAGDNTRAREWTATAVRLADRVGDVGLRSWAMVRTAEIALYTEDGATMVEWARRAAAAPESTAALRSAAAQRMAQGYALLGEASACLSALDEAHRWQEAATAESGPHYGSTSLPDQIAITRGWSLHHLDRSAESVLLLGSELDRIPPTSIRSRVRFGVRLALAELDCGDVEGPAPAWRPWSPTCAAPTAPPSGSTSTPCGGCCSSTPATRRPACCARS
ncbi:helix-turn-helix domain-containing protein [Actinokineospora soli]|uniref:Helix-turn-helix domain-containing protein n=1 Tax=Actinokineospora soli TaxID=1048753 RepID=A0ABW2TT44_9PSEU